MDHRVHDATSYWLTEAIKSASRRDPVDALNDAERLVAILKERLHQVTRQGGKETV